MNEPNSFDGWWWRFNLIALIHFIAFLLLHGFGLPLLSFGLLLAYSETHSETDTNIHGINISFGILNRFTSSQWDNNEITSQLSWVNVEASWSEFSLFWSFVAYIQHTIQLKSVVNLTKLQFYQWKQHKTSFWIDCFNIQFLIIKHLNFGVSSSNCFYIKFLIIKLDHHISEFVFFI